MGCRQGKFPEDEERFLIEENKLKDIAEKNNLMEVSDSIVKLVLKAGLLESQEDYFCKTQDGVPLFRVQPEQGQTKFVSPKGDLYCSIGVDARFSAINGVDALINLPHMYIYALKPFIPEAKANPTPIPEPKPEPQLKPCVLGKPIEIDFEPCILGKPTTETEFVLDNQPLYFWARTHKEGKSEFCTTLAQTKLGKGGDPKAMFCSDSYTLQIYPTGNIAIHRFQGNGGAICTLEDGEYKISIGPKVDPVLICASIMIYEVLKDR